MPAAPAAATTTQADAPLTLQRAIAMAMASNADLSAARHALQAAEGQVLQGQARPNPELSLLLEDTQRNTRSTTLQINQAFE